MNLVGWAERNGVARGSADRWFRAGLLPVPARRAGRLVLVDEPTGYAGLRHRTGVYAWVSSADQKADLDRQVVWVFAWAMAEQIPVDKVVTEAGSALNRHRRKFLAVPGGPSVHRIVVEHRDRSCRFGSQCVQAAPAAQGRELLVVDSAEVDDGLVQDMTEVGPSRCAHLCGMRAASNGAKWAVAAAAATEDRGAA